MTQPRWMLARGILGSGRTRGVSFRPFPSFSDWWWLISSVFLIRNSCHKTTHANGYYGTWPRWAVSISVLPLTEQLLNDSPEHTCSHHCLKNSSETSLETFTPGSLPWPSRSRLVMFLNTLLHHSTHPKVPNGPTHCLSPALDFKILPSWNQVSSSCCHH